MIIKIIEFKIFLKGRLTMTKKLEIYKCEICGNIVQVLIPGAGELVCCGETMKKQEIQYSNDETGEKHTPQIEIRDDKKYVTLNNHPMSEEHYIQFIEVTDKEKTKMYLKYLEPNEKAEFKIPKCISNNICYLTIILF